MNSATNSFNEVLGVPILNANFPYICMIELGSILIVVIQLHYFF